MPETKAFDVAAAWYVAPLSKLYVTPLVGFVTVIVPVVAPQMGCAVFVDGAFGTDNAALIVADVEGDTQPLPLSFIKTGYVPEGNAFEVANSW